MMILIEEDCSEIIWQFVDAAFLDSPNCSFNTQSCYWPDAS